MKTDDIKASITTFLLGGTILTAYFDSIENAREAFDAVMDAVQSIAERDEINFGPLVQIQKAAGIIAVQPAQIMGVELRELKQFEDMAIWHATHSEKLNERIRLAVAGPAVGFTGGNA